MLTDRANAAIRDDNARERALVIDEGTRMSGGRRQDLLSSMAYGDALAKVAEDLGNQYKLVFGRPGVLVPPKSFEVGVKKPDLTARGTLVRDKQPEQRSDAACSRRWLLALLVALAAPSMRAHGRSRSNRRFAAASIWCRSTSRSPIRPAAS